MGRRAGAASGWGTKGDGAENVRWGEKGRTWWGASCSRRRWDCERETPKTLEVPRKLGFAKSVLSPYKEGY